MRVGRCHDLELTEALLLGYEGRWGEPRGAGRGWARLHGLPVPPDPPPPDAAPPGHGQDALFDDLPRRRPAPDRSARGADRGVRRPASPGSPRPTHPGRFRLLVAAESAGALVAAEMGHDGLPWRADVHDELLRDLLGRAVAGAAGRRAGWSS